MVGNLIGGTRVYTANILFYILGIYSVVTFN